MQARPRKRPRRSPRSVDEPEREALRQAFGEGSTGKGVAKAVRGAAGAMKDLEDRQKSRATRVKRDTLDGALLDLAWFYRDVLVVQLGAQVELGNAGREADLRPAGRGDDAGDHAAQDPGDHALPGAAGAQRRTAARRRGDDAVPDPHLIAVPAPGPGAWDVTGRRGTAERDATVRRRRTLGSWA